MIPGAKFKIRTLQLAPGDSLIGYTNGVTEARSPKGEFFGDKRLVSLITDSFVSPCQRLEQIKTNVVAHMEAITVPGTIESLDAIAKYISAVAGQAGLDKKATYKLRLAIDEIATNIIIHGYQEVGKEGLLGVQADIDEHSVIIALEDIGAAFNPSEKVPVEAETLEQPLAQRPIGGLGIFIAFQGVDKFVYEKLGDRNRNIFVVKRGS